MKLPRILITAMRSGAGKTMLTCGILKAMKMQEINPASFKCGPDYIDPMFHKTVIGISSYNLDSFLCGENGVREILKKNGAGADISVMEGVMMGSQGSLQRRVLMTLPELPIPRL